MVLTKTQRKVAAIPVEQTTKYLKVLEDLHEQTNSDAGGFVNGGVFAKAHKVTSNVLTLLVKEGFVSKLRKEGNNVFYKWAYQGVIDEVVANKVINKLRGTSHTVAKENKPAKHDVNEDIAEKLRQKSMSKTVAKGTEAIAEAEDSKLVAFPEPREVSIMNNNVNIKGVRSLTFHVDGNQIIIEASTDEQVMVSVKIPNKLLQLIDHYQPGKIGIYRINAV